VDQAAAVSKNQMKINFLPSAHDPEQRQHERIPGTEIFEEVAWFRILSKKRYEL